VATDFFLKIDGIPGESQDTKHKDEIDIEAFYWGVTNQGSHSGGGGGGAGKAELQDFQFSTRLNKASPMLFLSCATGKHLKSAVLTARKAGKDLQEFLVVKFSDLLISSYQISGTEASAPPMDQVSFNFGRVDIEYRLQKPDGSPGGVVKAGWDVKQSKKV
jgi:type VI secretion system secreted protein Hcp